MRVRGLLTAVAVGLVAAAAPAGAQQSVDLRADAGLGGLGRIGRWTPIRLVISNRGSDLSGDVIVEWGGARLHRAIDAPAPSKTRIELYVRTTDVRDSIAVRLESHGQVIATANIPIRMIEGPLVVCGGEDGEASSASACSATIDSDAFPQSMRGWDAVDEVRVQPGAESRLDSRQRTALRRWRDYHDTEVRGLLSFAPRASWRGNVSNGFRETTLLASSAVVVPLIACAWIWIRARGSALTSYAAVAGAVVFGVLGSAFIGRTGPGAMVAVQHATTVQQVADGSVVSMRGAIEYPAFDVYAIALPGVDGSFVRRDSGDNEEWLDATGAPLRRGTVGRGVREDIELDAVVDFAPFRVSEVGTLVRVANQSGHTLSDCHFPDGFSRRDIGTLQPDAVVEAGETGAVEAPFFSCTMAASPVAFSDARFPVQMNGSAIVSVRLPTRVRDEGTP